MPAARLARAPLIRCSTALASSAAASIYKNRDQVFRELFLFASTSNSDYPEAHVPSKLDGKTPKAANALHGDQISVNETFPVLSELGRSTRFVSARANCSEFGFKG